MSDLVIAVLNERLFPLKNDSSATSIQEAVQIVKEEVRHLSLGDRRKVQSWLNSEYGLSI